jgi:hypothetical protein
MRHAVWIVATLVTASALASDPVPADVARGRDLSAYESGGVYLSSPNSEHLADADVERLRQFVWSHWTDKRRGYVQFVFRGIDAGNQNYFFIEPVDNRWRISWIEQHYQAIPGYSPPPPEVHREIVTVERCRRALIFFDSKDRVVTYL